MYVKEFIKSTFTCAIIHFINYSFRLPAIFSVVPLMMLMLLFMLFTRYWEDKKRQYVFLIPYVAEYFGFCLYFYNRGSLMPLTAVCMTAILAAWGVVCIECFVKNVRRNVIGILAFVLTCLVAYAVLGINYSVKARAAVEKVAGAEVLSGELAKGTDDACRELNAVFYGKTKVTFQLETLAEDLKTQDDVLSLWQEFQRNLSAADGKWISALVKEGESLSIKMEKFSSK